MIVHRVVYVIREGRTRDEAMELWKEYPGKPTIPTRVLSSTSLSPQQAALIFEWELADLSALQKEVREFFVNLGGRAFMERWLAICERNSVKDEVWEVLQ